MSSLGSGDRRYLDKFHAGQRVDDFLHIPVGTTFESAIRRGSRVQVIGRLQDPSSFVFIDGLRSQDGIFSTELMWRNFDSLPRDRRAGKEFLPQAFSVLELAQLLKFDRALKVRSLIKKLLVGLPEGNIVRFTDDRKFLEALFLAADLCVSPDFEIQRSVAPMSWRSGIPVPADPIMKDRARAIIPGSKDRVAMSHWAYRKVVRGLVSRLLLEAAQKVPIIYR